MYGSFANAVEKGLSANNFKAGRIRCSESFVLKDKVQVCQWRIARDLGYHAPWGKKYFYAPVNKTAEFEAKIGAKAEHLLLLH